MKQKKLMLLDGLHYLIPAIEAAHKLGAEVITCDYLPDNYAHKFLITRKNRRENYERICRKSSIG